MNDISTSYVLAEVAAERERQEAKWGEQNHPNGTGPGALEGLIADGRHHGAVELERWAVNRCDTLHSAGDGTWEHILTEEWAEAVACADPAALRCELVQVAAVAVAWIEAIDRRTAVEGGEGR